jgi:hypothetical protein
MKQAESRAGLYDGFRRASDNKIAKLRLKVRNAIEALEQAQPSFNVSQEAASELEQVANVSERKSSLS